MLELLNVGWVKMIGALTALGGLVYLRFTSPEQEKKRIRNELAKLNKQLEVQRKKRDEILSKVRTVEDSIELDYTVTLIARLRKKIRNLERQ